MVTYKLDFIRDIEPGEEREYSDADGYKGTVKDEIREVSFTESFKTKYSTPNEAKEKK